MSWFRIEKAIPRGMTLLEAFPLEVGTDKIIYNELPKTCHDVIANLSKILSKIETIIHVGTYAIQFMTLNKEKLMLPYELISVEYNTDVRKIYNQLIDHGYKIELKEYFPYFQFWDRHLEFIHNNEIILTVYNNNQRCIPYRRYDSGNIASFQQILNHHLIKYYFYINNKIDPTNVNNILGELIRTRNDYLKKNNKTVMDDTMYREFMISCLGKAFDARRQMFLDYKKKREQGKRTAYRYDPQENFHDKLPNYVFDNTSGNVINNPKLYTIQISNGKKENDKNDEGNINSEDSTEQKRFTKKRGSKKRESKKRGSKKIGSKKRASKKRGSKKRGSIERTNKRIINIEVDNTNYPFIDPLLDTDYTSSAGI
jgi:hypothetical protein